MSATLALFLATTFLQTPKAETALVSDMSTIQPGVPFTVALQIKMPESWHTYYLNPGEAGQATEIQWKLPAGFTAGAIQWPVPERTDFEGIASFVYDNEAWLLTTITPPKTLAIGKPVTLAANAKWLLCSTGCVPQSSSLKLVLQTAAKAEPNKSAAAQFAVARQAIPQSAKTLSISAVAKPKAVLLKFAGAAPAQGVQFIPADADAFGASTAKVTARDGGLDILVGLSAYAKTLPTRMKGILIIPKGESGKSAYLVDVPVARS